MEKLGQMKRLLNCEKRTHWTSQDIATAISLRSVSPKAYRYLKKNKYPLPALSTLREWALYLSVRQGILHDIIILMKNKSRELNSSRCLTVLTFDEIYISNMICIDKENEQKLGPHKCCQTVMARGLLGKWKQPIYIKFDQPITKKIITDIISELYKAGFIVVSITSDMAPRNISLWSELKVGHNKECSFNHPCDETLKIFVFSDVPHLLKLVRNQLLDNGFNIDGNLVDRSCFEKLLSVSSNEITIIHKISRYHLDAKGSGRQKVLPAAQLLSNTVSKAIEYCGKNGYTKNIKWKECHQLIKLINDWFDFQEIWNPFRL